MQRYASGKAINRDALTSGGHLEMRVSKSAQRGSTHGRLSVGDCRALPVQTVIGARRRRDFAKNFHCYDAAAVALSDFGFVQGADYPFIL